MTDQWQPALAYVHPKLGVKGRVGYTQAWVAKHDKPPKYLLIRAADGTGTPLVLRTFRRPGEDEDLIITSEELATIAGDGVTALGATVQYQAADRTARLRYTPGAVQAIIVATLAWLSTTAAAGFAYLRLVAEPPPAGTGSGTAGWLLAGAAVVLCTAAIWATARLVKEVREARR